MEKNTLKAIVVIAIVIGAAGVTFGYITMTQPEPINPILILSQIAGGEEAATPQQGVLNTWYTQFDGEFTTTNTWPNCVNITQMNTTIIIEGTNKISLYLSLNCIARTDGPNYVYLRFALDGVSQHPPYVSSYGSLYMSVSLQQIIFNVTPGVHLIQVQAGVNSGTGYFGGNSGMTLVIQSLVQ